MFSFTVRNFSSVSFLGDVNSHRRARFFFPPHPANLCTAIQSKPLPQFQLRGKSPKKKTVIGDIYYLKLNKIIK